VLPFPVETPYRMRADLARCDGQPLPVGPDDWSVLQAKLAALRNHPERVRVADPRRTPAELEEELAATLPTLAELRPDLLHPVGHRLDGVPATGEDPASAVFADVHGRRWVFPRLGTEAAALVRSVPGPSRLADALALSLPEDLVWMRDDGGAGRATLLHVAFPSHWAPDERAGASLLELHGPVADGERLRAASAALMRAIVSMGPFRRHIWSITATPDLDRHPLTAGRPGGNANERGWFRVERQTTVPFPEAGLALFAIRVLVAPLQEVLAVEMDRAARLAASIRSMSPEVRVYKGVADPGLLERLDAATADAAPLEGAEF